MILEATMSADLLYALVFLLLANLILVPSLIATRSGLVARWDRQWRLARFNRSFETLL